MKTILTRTAMLVLLLSLLLVSSGCFASGGETRTADEGLRVIFYKIGKADAALVTGSGADGAPFSVLIDTGEADDAPELIGKLRDAGVKTLDYLILTHFDKDHIGGFPALAEQIPAERILMPDYTGTGEAYDAMCAALLSCRNAERLTADQTFSLGSAAFFVSVPMAEEYEKNQDNNSSLVVEITAYGQTLLFAGDAEAARQAELLDAGQDAVTLLKVPHHGVWNKGLDVFFEACSPQYAVITCSQKNPPEEKTLNALTLLGTRIFETSNGDVTVKIDATGILVTQ